MFLLTKTGLRAVWPKRGQAPLWTLPGPAGGPKTRRAACMARPRKTPQEKRDDLLGVRLTTAERAEVEHNAAAFGIGPAEFIRRRTLGYRLPEAAAVQQARASLGAAFNRLGVNLNQIAHKLHSDRDPSD